MIEPSRKILTEILYERARGQLRVSPELYPLFNALDPTIRAFGMYWPLLGVKLIRDTNLRGMEICDETLEVFDIFEYHKALAGKAYPYSYVRKEDR